MNEHPGIEECATKVGWKVVPVTLINAPVVPLIPHWGPMFTKLLVWKMTEFDKIIVLDADMLVYQNFDELWDTDTSFGAVKDFDNGRFVSGFNAGTGKSYLTF